MTDNNNVFILFEELKGMLKGMVNKLEELPKVINVQQSIGDNKQDLSPIKEVLAKQWEAYAHTSNMILKRIGMFTEMVERLKEQKQEMQAEPQEHIHKHSFDIKSSKVFSFVVGTAIVCSISLWCNVELWKSKRQYEDDALKFKFIRANKGCSSKDILWLNEIFDIHRSKSDIEMIEEQVEHYNSSLKATTDSLIQVRLQENKNHK